jgi:NAD(P)-dependent dehydrogenase (short-subunit alcohol dehydrogenase family)
LAPGAAAWQDGGMTQSSRERVALVTGAASGIGRATVRALMHDVAAVALHTRGTAEASRVRLSEVAAEAKAAGAAVLELHGDLAVPGTGARLIAEALAAFGRLDHVVSNAGYSDRRPVAELARGDLDLAHTTMAGAFFEMAKAAAPALTASPQGRIVLVSSFVAHRFVAGGNFPSSASAKAAAEALAKALAAELAPAGVTVNAVLPGYTRKDGGHSALNPEAWKRAAEITPMGRLAEPEDIAHLIAFLLSDKARHITGQAIAVDGGLLLG